MWRSAIIRAGLESMWASGAHVLARRALGGVGAILTMHHVRPANERSFHPNRILEITPEFLDAVLQRVRRAHFDVVDLVEAHRRLTTPGEYRRFVVLTFDDGYRDNREHAWPVLKRYDAPFTIYVPPSYPDGRGELWWLALEELVDRHETLTIEIEKTARVLTTATLEQKQSVFDELYWWMRGLDDSAQRRVLRDVCGRYGIDLAAMCRREIMGWDEIVDMARDPLVTIGAHTVDHPALARLSEEDARRQMRESADALKTVLGRRPRHFSYPYGSPCAAGPREFRLAAELGFLTAVTTRPGVLYPEHAQHLTALPRISLNGEFQSLRYLDVFLSGLPFFVWNGFGRLNVA